MPTKDQLHEALDESRFFQKFKEVTPKRFLRSKRSKTGPRDNCEEEYALDLESHLELEAEHLLYRDYCGNDRITVTDDPTIYNENSTKKNNNKKNNFYKKRKNNNKKNSSQNHELSKNVTIHKLDPLESTSKIKYEKII